MKFQIQWLKNQIVFPWHNEKRILGMLEECVLEAEIENQIITVHIPYNRQDLNALYHIIGSVYGYHNILEHKPLAENLPVINFDISADINNIDVILLTSSSCLHTLDTPDYIISLLKLNNVKINGFITNILNYTKLIYNVFFIYIPIDISKQYSINSKGQILLGDQLIYDDNTLIYDDLTSKNIAIIGLYKHKENIIEITVIKQAIAHLIKEIQNNCTIIDIKCYSHHICLKHNSIALNSSRFKKIIGYELTKDMIMVLAQHTNMSIINEDNDIFTISIPKYREDLKEEIDLIEEIVFINGVSYKSNKELYVTTPLNTIRQDNLTNIIFIKYLAHIGYNQVVNFSFIDSITNNVFSYPNNTSIKVGNPLSLDSAELKQSLISGLCGNLEYNVNRQCLNLHIFEIGKKFSDQSEILTIAGLSFGSKNKYNWKNNIIPDFHLMLGDIIHLLPEDYYLEYCEDIKWLDENISCYIVHNSTRIGILGQLKSNIIQNKLIKNMPFIFELDLDKINDVRRVSLEDIDIHPSPIRDISITMSSTLSVKLMVESIKKSSIMNLIKEVFVKEVYYPTAHTKSVTFRLSFLNKNNNITDLIVNECVDFINQILQNHTK